MLLQSRLASYICMLVIYWQFGTTSLFSQAPIPPSSIYRDPCGNFSTEDNYEGFGKYDLFNWTGVAPAGTSFSKIFRVANGATPIADVVVTQPLGLPSFSILVPLLTGTPTITVTEENFYEGSTFDWYTEGVNPTTMFVTAPNGSARYIFAGQSIVWASIVPAASAKVEVEIANAATSTTITGMYDYLEYMYKQHGMYVEAVIPVE